MAVGIGGNLPALRLSCEEGGVFFAADGNRAFGDAAQCVVVKAVFEIDGHFGVSFFVYRRFAIK